MHFDNIDQEWRNVLRLSAVNDEGYQDTKDRVSNLPLAWIAKGIFGTCGALTQNTLATILFLGFI
jgi:hypothetical protein